MDALFEVLRSSTDNAARKEAAARLRELQTRDPETFLQHTYDGIVSAQLAPELRFFLCTLVLAFLDESWHNGVSKEAQERFLTLYVCLLLTGQHGSLLLARKLSQIVAVMAKRSSRKAQLGALPPRVEQVVMAYVAELEQATAASASSRITHALLYLHVFLKEMQGIRLGNVFDGVCRACVAPLSGVFALLPSDASMLEAYDMCLYLFKCSLRTFGRAIFDPAFCHFLLTATWRLAAGLGQDGVDTPQAERRRRLLEYALKIHEATVVYFPSRLHELGIGFFVSAAETSSAATASGAASAPPDQSLFRLLSAVVSSPVGDVVSEKAVCRAQRLLTSLLSAEDGDAFVADCLHRYTAAAYFAPTLQHMIATFLADVTAAETLAEWARHPEEVAAELDVDMDDEASVMSCTEQLFLALTGSTGCAAASLATAWSVVNVLLQEGEPGPVTAALHTIGIGYYTMASEDNTAYLGFLRERLLPLLQPAALAQSSAFVTRRIVWLVGMWCESVADTTARRTVLAALEAVLQHAVAAQNVVLVLVSLRSTENFISDNQFTLDDLPPSLVATVLHTIQELLTRVQSPTTVKGLAGLVHVLIEKGAVTTQGDVLVRLFLPPVLGIIEGYETQAAEAQERAAAHVGVADTGADDDGDDGVDGSLGSLGMLLDCLGSSLRHGDSDAVLWSLLTSVVVPCTSPARAATAWVEDNAWELFLTMAQSSRSFFNPTAAEALSLALQHTTRDFAMLPLVFRVVYTLLLLRQSAAEEVVTLAQLETWLVALRESRSAELCGAIAAVALAIARTSGGPLRAALCHHAVHALLLTSDVQAEQNAIPLAAVLAISFAVAACEGSEQQLAAQVQASVQSCGPFFTYAHLLEQVVLLLDVSPSELVSRALARLLEALCRTSATPICGDDQAMVQRAVEGVSAAARATVSMDGEAAEEARDGREMVLELLGDEGVPASAPHFARVMDAFAVLL